MPDLQFERQQLLIADLHLMQAERCLAQMRASIEEEQRLGVDTAPVEQALAATRDAVAAFRAHRELIASTIRDIESGRLPNNAP